jgi:[ribosomal protein S5]-alanine N-acetyltransferase
MTKDALVTDRLILRKWKEADLLPFSEMNKDIEVMRYFPTVLTDLQSTEMMQRIINHFEKNGFGLYAVENRETNQFMGFTGLSIPNFESFFTPCVEIGWRYKKEYWGMGYASEAALACVQFGFSTLKLSKIVSFTATINTNSEKVMKRIGMHYVTEFEHPKVDISHILCRHVLYEIRPSDLQLK